MTMHKYLSIIEYKTSVSSVGTALIPFELDFPSVEVTK